MAEAERVNEPWASIMEWLAGEPDDDPVADLAALRGHFQRVPEQQLSGAEREVCLEQFAARIGDIGGRFRARLLTAKLPIGRDLHQVAAALIEALIEVAGGFLRLVDDVSARRVRGVRQEGTALGARGLALVSDAYLLGAMAGLAPPFGLWQRAHALWLAAGGLADGDGVAALGLQYRRLFALAVSQPEGLTARELSWLFDYLERHGASAQLGIEPIAPEDLAHWVDPAGDAPPVAMARKSPDMTQGLLYFCTLPLVRTLAVQIEQLEKGLLAAEAASLRRADDVVVAAEAGLPEGLEPAEVLALLGRLRDRWATPPVREQARRMHQYTVQVCTGLRAIWALGRGEADGRVAEWLVFNESPGGYAIMCVGGVEGELSAGMVLALRRDPTLPWSICVVRWIRNDDPERVELGLQVLAQGFTSVLVGFRGNGGRSTSPSLMLPASPAIRRNPAILAAAGAYVSRRFVLVHEGEHLYVAQGRVLGLDMQTASVELFQYEIDPYPI